MKNVLSTLTILISFISFGQTLTRYGTGTGTQGNGSTFIGYHAGNRSSTYAFLNTFIGNGSGQTTTVGAYLTGDYNTAVGGNSLPSLISGSNNVAIGTASLHENRSASYNVAVGSYSLYKNTKSFNTAVGYNSLYNSDNSYNTALGYRAAFSSSSADYITAVGANALTSSTTGRSNTAVGGNSMKNNTTGGYNTAVGRGASEYNTTGSFNTAVGLYAARKNTTGRNLAALGSYSLYSNTTGSYNSSLGHYSNYRNTTGASNTSVGYYALYNNTTGNYNTSIGRSSGTSQKTGSYNTFLGYSANVSSSSITVSNATAVGNGARVTGSNQVRIGNTAVTSIGGQVSWSTLSDGRFKREIKEDISGLEFVNQLRPVSYTVDHKSLSGFLNKGMHESDQAEGEEPETARFEEETVPNKRYTGFIAQEVQELVQKTGYTFDGIVEPESESDYYSIKYSEFVVPLVKAVQELSAQVVLQQSQINSLLARLADEEDGAGAVDEINSGEVQKAELGKNRPNPFSEVTRIEVTVPSTSVQASVKVYDLKGTEIKSIVVDQRGEALIDVNSLGLDNGMYIYALVVDGAFVSSKKMLVSK